MNKVFEKIIENLEGKRKTAELLIMENPQDELDRIQTQTAEDFASAYKNAIEIVKQEAEKFGTDTNVGSNGWIPCSSGVMPKECITKDGYTDPSEEVLVYIYYGENCVNNGCGVSRYWEHTKFHKNPWIDLKYGKENVIAWMELPSAYRPKEK